MELDEGLSDGLEEECEEPNAARSITAAAQKKKKKKKTKKSKGGAKNDILASLSVEENSPLVFLSSDQLVNNWWTSYQAAFRKEHDWMEEGGQSTSRKMKLTAPRMLSLVFNDEIGSNLKRVCYFATVGSTSSTNSSSTSSSSSSSSIGTRDSTTDSATSRVLGDACVCGYATVDEDPNPSGVCHLRMLLVSPEFQRKGIGLAILHHVISSDRFSARHIGLKFARCNDYESFYGKSGFCKIGADDLYTYMALRR
jgi:hypothetical protein